MNWVYNADAARVADDRTYENSKKTIKFIRALLRNLPQSNPLGPSFTTEDIKKINEPFPHDSLRASSQEETYPSMAPLVPQGREEPAGHASMARSS